MNALPEEILEMILGRVIGGPANQVCSLWRRIMGKHRYNIRCFNSPALCVIAVMCGYVPDTSVWAHGIRDQQIEFFTETLRSIPKSAHEEFINAYIKHDTSLEGRKQWEESYGRGITVDDIVDRLWNPYRDPRYTPFTLKSACLALYDIGMVDMAVIIASLKTRIDYEGRLEKVRMDKVFKASREPQTTP